MATESLLAACPACAAKNRIPVARVGQGGRCGRCRQDLPPGAFYATEPVSVPETKFDTLTRLSPNPVLADFWATWCAPCHQTAPLLEQLAQELTGRLLVIKIDTERAASTATRFGIQSVPTLVILRGGLEVDRIAGLIGLPALRQRLDRFLT